MAAFRQVHFSHPSTTCMDVRSLVSSLLVMDKGKGDHWPITGAVKTSSDTCMMSNGFAELRTTLIPL